MAQSSLDKIKRIQAIMALDIFSSIRHHWQNTDIFWLNYGIRRRIQTFYGSRYFFSIKASLAQYRLLWLLIYFPQLRHHGEYRLCPRKRLYTNLFFVFFEKLPSVSSQPLIHRDLSPLSTTKKFIFLFFGLFEVITL